MLKFRLVLVIILLIVSNSVYCDYSNSTSNVDYLTFLNSKFNDEYRDVLRDSIDREPKLISYEKINNQLVVKMQLNVPFLNIPVKRSIDGAMNVGKTTLVGLAFGKLNPAGIILSVVIFVALNLILRLKNLDYVSKMMSEEKMSSSDEDILLRRKSGNVVDNFIPNLMDKLHRTFLKYDTHSTVCTQRIMCWFVKNSVVNVNLGNGSKLDRIIHGMTR